MVLTTTRPVTQFADVAVKRVQETDALAAAAGEGQRKQNGAYQDHKREADDDGLCRREVNLGDQPQVLLDF